MLQLKNNETVSPKHRLLLVSEHEWWVLWGILIGALAVGKGGLEMFEEEKLRTFLTPTKLGKDENSVVYGMTKNRFKNLNELVHFSFFDHSRPDDPWHPILLLVDGYNNNL